MVNQLLSSVSSTIYYQISQSPQENVKDKCTVLGSSPPFSHLGVPHIFWGPQTIRVVSNSSRVKNETDTHQDTISKCGNCFATIRTNPWPVHSQCWIASAFCCNLCKNFFNRETPKYFNRWHLIQTPERAKKIFDYLQSLVALRVLDLHVRAHKQ